MKRVHPPIQNQELPTHTPFFNKESDQPFFSNSDSLFPKTSIQKKSDQEGEQEDEGIGAEKLVQKMSDPVAGADNSNNTTADKIAIQRKCAECEKEEKHQEEEGVAVQRKEDNSTGTAPDATPATNTQAVALFLVDDNTVPGVTQMRKTAFLDRLKSEVCDTVNQALAGTPFTSANCPYLQASFVRHQNSSPAQIEELIKRYCPSAMQAKNAEDLIQHMKIKVHGAALQWVKTGGDMSGAELAFGGIASGISQLGGSIVSGVGSMAGSIKSGIGNAVSGVANMLFKENTGGATSSQSPQAVMQSLGNGSSIESGTRSKMEDAFGTSFSDVKVHADDHAAQLSSDMNARAFTVGNHIAFAADEYQPGTMMGDALMAHELAHTMQQAGNIHQKGELDNQTENSLEHDADANAAEAVASIWSNKSSTKKKDIRPKIKKGLSITRCKKTPPPKKAIEKMDLTELKEIINNPDKYSLGEVGAAKARAMMLEHQESVAKTGKGTMQGNKCSTPPSGGVAKHDCTTYVLDVLKFAFAAKGQGALWDDIFNTAETNSNAPKYGTNKGFKGVELIRSLIDKAGWKAVFWSPDPRNPADNLPEHPTAYKTVNNAGTYYDVPVNKEDSVVNYRRTDPNKAKDTSKLDKLKLVPLAVIAAKGGMHMTVLINGVVYEVHWELPETDPNVVQATPLENWEWNSGTLVMPDSDYKKAFKGE
jgi:hypothetical protein